MLKKLLMGAAAVLVLTAASQAQAATTINGAIYFGGGGTNYYSPASGFVPAGYGNSAGLPVVVGAGTEFGFHDNSNLNTADFTTNSLRLTDKVSSLAFDWTQVFTASTPGFFDGITLASTNFTGLTFSVAGDTLTVNWGGTKSPAELYADFRFGGAAVPEPATWAMLIAGFGLAGTALRRRRSLAFA